MYFTVVIWDCNIYIKNLPAIRYCKLCFAVTIEFISMLSVIIIIKIAHINTCNCYVFPQKRVSVT